MTDNKRGTRLSGISIALAFIGLGIVYGSYFIEAFGGMTRYISGFLYVFGAAALTIELQKILNRDSSIRLDNGGVGLLVLVPSLIVAQLAYVHTDGFIRYALMTLLSIGMLLGLSAVIDLIVSIVEDLAKSKNIFRLIIEALKYLALLLSTVASVIAALNQFF